MGDTLRILWLYLNGHVRPRSMYILGPSALTQESDVPEIRHALQLEREVSKTTTWLTLFKSPGHRKRLRIILAIGLFSQWSGNGLVKPLVLSHNGSSLMIAWKVSYYINLVLEAIGIQDTQTKTWINGVLQVWNLIVAVCKFSYECIGIPKSSF